MSIKKHQFTNSIIDILEEDFPGLGEELFESSPLLQYLNIKTKSADRGSKSRSSFANHYALYVLIEDYISGGFVKSETYKKYQGAQYSDLLDRMRELPFGSKLQNHALNHRLNEEFKKYFPTIEQTPIVRNSETLKYWVNEQLLIVKYSGKLFNLAPSVIKIIDAYVETKKESFMQFIEDCKMLKDISKNDPRKAIEFIKALVRPNVDARIFEIVSYAILKEEYSGKNIFWGFSKESIVKENLKLYKTGRTNANDGGIDFVMKPLGRFFQVTETLDVKKYFLDIDKVECFPITFVIKSEDTSAILRKSMESQAKQLYNIDAVVKKYMDCIEEIINIPTLVGYLDGFAKDNRLNSIIDEIIKQSMLEFNYDEE